MKCPIEYGLHLFTSFTYFLFLAVLLFSCLVVSYSFVTPWTVAHQAPPSTGFSRQEYWSGFPVPSPSCLLPVSWPQMYCPWWVLGRQNISFFFSSFFKLIESKREIFKTVQFVISPLWSLISPISREHCAPTTVCIHQVKVLFTTYCHCFPSHLPSPIKLEGRNCILIAVLLSSAYYCV